MRGVLLEVLDTRNSAKKILTNKFLLGTPGFLSTVVDDCILMWVVVIVQEAGWFGEEVGEEVEVDEVVVVVVGGSELYGGGGDGRRTPNDVFGRWRAEWGCRWASTDGGGDDGRWDILEFDVVFLDEGGYFERVYHGRVSGDVVLVEESKLVLSDVDESVEEGVRRRRWVLEERRGGRSDEWDDGMLLWQESVLHSEGRVLDVDLVFLAYF